MIDGYAPATRFGTSTRIGGWMLIAMAASWSTVLLGLAYTLPVESSPSISVRSNGMYDYPKVPLVRINGTHVLYLVAVPFVVSVAVAFLSLLRLRFGWVAAAWAAWTLSGLIVIAGVLGTVTILVGVYILPTGGLLLGACAVFGASRSTAVPPDPPRPRPPWEEPATLESDGRRRDGGRG